MGQQLPEPYDPSPDDPYRPPPKHREPTYPPGRDETAQSMAEQGRPLPIAYGRVKLPVLVIERLTPLQQDPPAWTASTQYTPGFVVQNGGNGYEVTSGGVGTSAASGGPTGTGVGITDGTVIWKFRQQLPMPIYVQRFIGALCEGEVTTAISIWIDKENSAAANGTIFVRAMELKKGPDAGGQTLTTGMGWDSIGYQHTALIQPISGMVGIPSGTQKEMQQLAVELDTVMLGASTPDVNPGDIINDLLTHARRGCVWPGSRVDTSITGTAAGGYRVYCDAAGFRFSMAMSEARFARDWIADVLVATNSEAVWSSGKLKVVPLGDQDIASPVYGATGYVSANLVQYALGPNDFKRASWTRRKDPECFNTWPVEYTNRANNYARLTEDSPDALDVEKRSVLNPGSAKATAQTVSLPVIFPDGTQAVLLSGILTQRSLYNRNTYRITGVPWRYILTEPTDVISLTDPVSGLSLVPMRIVEWEEGADGETIDITAEDYGTAVQAAARYTPQAGDGAKPNEAATLAAALPLSGVIGTADRNVTIGIYTYSSAWFRILRSLDGDATNQGGAGVAWYRGNIDPALTGAGAPIIRDVANGERLSIVSFAPSALYNAAFNAQTLLMIPIDFTIQPKANTDNLDAMRFLEITFYSGAGAALSNGAVYRITIPDRRYNVPATPSNAGNSIHILKTFLLPNEVQRAYVAAPNNFDGYARVTLYNAYGPSDARDYGQAPNSAAAWAGGATIPGLGGAPTGGGGGGSSYCPTPNARILLPGGQTIAAGDLRDGMEVAGFRERDFEHELVGVARYVSHHLAPMLYAVKLTDGRVLRYSKDHRLCSVARGWLTVQDLQPGEQLVARVDSVVEKIAADGPGHVVGFVVEGPHTYFTDDVLSHNAKQQVP